MIPALNPNIAKTVNQVNNDPKVKAGFVNLGNNKLNVNTTTAKGLEKAIGVISKFIIKAQGKVSGILYGQYKLKQDEGTAIQRALDKGVDNLLTDFAGVDFCNLFNYALTQIPGGTSFNPNIDPPNDPISRAKWNLQNKAFQVQKAIDQYEASYGDVNNSESKLGLSTLIRQITDAFQTVLAPDTGINDPLLLSTFPQLSTAGNFLQNALGRFNQYNDVRDIPNTDVVKLLNTIDKVKYYCIAIQGLNSPATVLNFADSIIDGDVQQQIAKINKLVPLKDISKLLKSILRLANNINSVGQNAIKYINTARTVIKIAVLIIKVFNVVKAFLLGNPLPNLFTTSGITTLFSDTYQEKLSNNGTKKLIKRLNQINAVLNLMTIFVTSLVAGMGSIIGKLNLILLNIENCNNVDPELKQDLINTITNLTNTANTLQDFLDRSNQTEDNKNKRFGEYTIEIVTEQITDEGINLKRRYGIARNSSGYIVVESTPTFASLDLIIINEVKVLLVSKGLVNSNIGGLSSEEEVTVIDALSYLETDDINIDTVTISDQDVENYKTQDAELGLSTFVDNLPGGKSLRKKVRSILSKQSDKLKSNLQATDPEGRYSNSVSGVSNLAGGIANSTPNPNQLEIDRLEKEKQTLQERLVTVASNSVLLAITIKKIKEVDAQLKKLKNN
jgi:hypothetical protein